MVVEGQVEVFGGGERRAYGRGTRHDADSVGAAVVKDEGRLYGGSQGGVQLLIGDQHLTCHYLHTQRRSEHTRLSGGSFRDS